jgi:hypothetical protein
MVSDVPSNTDIADRLSTSTVKDLLREFRSTQHPIEVDLRKLVHWVTATTRQVNILSRLESGQQKRIENFDGQTTSAQIEREHALFLLSQFMYFGSRELRELLRALYRDLFRYPIIEKIRRNNNDSSDLELIREKFRDELRHTRFLGVGNPAESGVHLLYYFRQENGLPTELFLDSQRLFKRTKRSWLGFGRLSLRDPSIRGVARRT